MPLPILLMFWFDVSSGDIAIKIHHYQVAGGL